MRGVWIEDGEVRLRTDLPSPEPAPDETRVAVTRVGLCATDLALARGYMGFRGVPGHEFTGVALEGPLEGRAVVGEINAACGVCPRCRAGLERHCPERTVLGILGRPGAFAETLRMPTRNLHPLPEGLPLDRAVFAEPLAAAFEIPEQVDLAGFERRLVLGDGRLGLLCAQVLGLDGAAVDVAGRHPERLEGLSGDLRARGPLEGLGDGPWDLVVEATGRPEALPAALARVAPRGTLVLKTTAERAIPLDLTSLVVDEITLVGSRCGPFAPALEALADGRVHVEPLIEGRYGLEAAPEAFARAASGGVLKLLVEP